jgi:hypothetical protein
VVIEALDGRRIATGKLGQNRGMRAVRLVPATSAGAVEPPPPREALRAAASG